MSSPPSTARPCKPWGTWRREIVRLRKARKSGISFSCLLAAACFVHCVAGPLLLSFAGLAGLSAISEKAEPLFLAGSVIIGTANLIPGYRKKHRRLVCLAMFLAGIICLFLRRRFSVTAEA